MEREIVILGAGESGTGAALLAKARGLNVFVSDNGKIAPHFQKELTEQNIPFEEGNHSGNRILKADEVIKSPGIGDSVALIMKLKELKIPVISDIEFAGRYSKAHVIGITGSNGKTTTTLWLYHIMKMAGMDVELSGNVGVSPCRILVERDPAYFVMELSSFQLDGLIDFRVNTAILTNITPDHLDRYDYDFRKYIDSKLRVIANQSADDSFIWCLDDPVINKSMKTGMTPARLMPFSLNKETPAKVVNRELLIKESDTMLSVPLNEIALKGKHNLYNAMAVALAAYSAGVKPEMIVKGLTTFKGVEHRMEQIDEKDGVLYINDSKATNVNSAWYALESMTRPVVWIAGGTDKGNDYSDLKDLVSSKVKVLICLGKDNRKLVKAFKGVVPELRETESMQAAVSAARQLVVAGDVVLLSPACASFDLFENYIQRGQQFKQLVAEI